MSQTTLIVDGETLLNQNLNQYTPQPPQFLAQLAAHKTKNTKPQPHLQAALTAILHAIQTQQDTTITITTHTNGWNMEVTQI